LPDNQITDRVVHLQPPDTIFVTNKRMVIRDPSLLGVRENIVSVSYDQNNPIELERGVFSSKIIIRARRFADEMEAISKKSGRTNSSICEEFNG
jgi:hypothetical protein